jgi:hypothetical protein
VGTTIRARIQVTAPGDASREAGAHVEHAARGAGAEIDWAPSPIWCPNRSESAPIEGNRDAGPLETVELFLPFSSRMAVSVRLSGVPHRTQEVAGSSPASSIAQSACYG